ncbi:MAG: alpha-amylase family glycosyl hydrolase [Bacteroidales bacterium]
MLCRMAGWFKHAVIYQVLIDRFAGYRFPANWEKPVFIGGNLKGVIKKIDYLKTLGIDAVWLSPFYVTDRYHGYHVTDFYEVDPRFGTISDLKLLVSTAHKNQIRVIADFIPNHCSVNHPFFKDVSVNRKSKYYEWFVFKKWPDHYLSFLHYKELPKLNLRNPDTANHIIGAAKHWLETGIDGFRIDHVVGPHYSFWKKFKKEAKTVSKDTVLIGEAWLSGIRFRDIKTLGLKHKYLKWATGYNQEDVQNEFTGVLDGVLDFNMRDRLVEYIAWKDKPGLYLDRLNGGIKDHYKKYPAGYFLPGFIDNHDMSRFMYECGNDIEKLKLALRTQLLQPQPQIIYYGTETGLSHAKPVLINKANSDLQARKPMPWENLHNDLIGYCRDLIIERKKLYQVKTC